MSSSRPLSERVIQSALWRVSNTAVVNILNFFTFIILARYFSPAEFGVFALASLFVAISVMISNAGLGDVIIREANPDDDLKSTIFWSNIGIGALLSAVLILLSPVIANYIGDPRTGLILVVLSLTLLITPLTTVNSAMALRELKLRNIELIGLACAVIGSIASIAVAVAGGGLWALVAGNVSSSILNLVLVSAVFPWRPKFRYSFSTLKEVLPFSSNILFSQIVQILIVRLQELIASVMLSLTAVGVYRVGTRFTELIASAFVGPVASLGLASLSKVRDDPQRMSNAYIKMISITSFIYCPIMLGFAAIAADAIPFLFGDKWLPAVGVAQILSLLAPAVVMSYFHGPILSAVGRSDVLRKITIVQLLGTLIFCTIGAQYGVVGMAIGFLLRSYLTLPLQMRWLQNASHVRAGRALMAALRPATASLLMAGIVYTMQPWLNDVMSLAPARICISILVGALSYVLIMFTVFRGYSKTYVSAFREIVQAIRTRGQSA